MKNRPYNLIILSAEKAGATSKRNQRATELLAGMLLLWGHEHSKIDGQYNGIKEKSFAVKVYPPIEDALPLLQHMAFRGLEQQSILLVDTQDRAYLIYNDGYETFLGKWTDVTGLASQDDYDKVGDYSKIGDRYFSIL